jgi:hypothetical protein
LVPENYITIASLSQHWRHRSLKSDDWLVELILPREDWKQTELAIKQQDPLNAMTSAKVEGFWGSAVI